MKREKADATRRVLVTGASRGIGRAVALRLARDGHDVAVNYLRSKDAAEEVVAEVQALGRSAAALPFDVADREACADALAFHGLGRRRTKHVCSAKIRVLHERDVTLPSRRTVPARLDSASGRRVEPR